MPSIIIKEKDRTGAESTQYEDYTVLIPGTAAAGVSGEYLLSTEDELKAEIGKGEHLGKAYVSYNMAKRLLSLGMQVLYVVTDELAAGEDFFDKFMDKGLYDLRFITAGEFETDLALAEEVIACAAGRRDCVALINVPAEMSEGLESGELPIKLDTAEKISRWLDLLPDEPFIVGDVEDDVKETPCKYAAAFAGKFTIANDKLGIEFPAFFEYLVCFANYIHSYASWYAMSGSVRGKSPFGKLDLVGLNFGDADIAVLQNRDTEGKKSCNVIANIRPYGNIVWGNRTLHPIVKDEETDTVGLRASNFLNIRQLCCDLKKRIYRACRRFTFEPNSDTLWVRFSNEITSLLDKMKSDQGIRGYKLIQEQTSKKATLKAIIRIIPIEAVEDFDITVELADSIEIGE